MTNLKRILIFIVTITVLLFTITQLIRRVQILKKENLRITNNFENVTNELKSTRNDLGQLTVTYGTLELTKYELKKYNDSLVDELKDLNIKLRNVETTTTIEYKYKTKIDTFEILKLSDTSFIANYENKWIKLNQNIKVYDDVNGENNLIIDSINIELLDKLLIVQEGIYKRRWIFWRKKVGTKINIKSDNPYIDIDKSETIIFKN